ncbi:MAG TPA: gamma-glutamylcyclotransferase family protein [Hyphomicrobiales bacterium]|nr:gamma-glutamylcyclotransferase family protein [Hyphomicrobiales bacterium]
MREEPRHLFVYGTLKRGSRNRYANILQRRAQFIGEAFARGRLYRIGSFPGAVFDVSCPGKVFGEVFHLSSLDLLSELDVYEGCEGNVESDPFRRDIIRVQFAHGRALHAWAYSYVANLPGWAVIPTGRFTP